MAGRETGHVPFRVDGLAARLGLSRLVLRVIFHRVLSIATPIGRRLRSRMLHRAAPLIRTKGKDLTAAGVLRVPRVAGVRNGLPLLEDGRVLDVANVVWCTGFGLDTDWIHAPLGDEAYPAQSRGVVAAAPGLYFVGLPFLRGFYSMLVGGVARDADHVAGHIARRQGRVPAQRAATEAADTARR
jgi:putative flavoprotein involved in K+ transport